VRRTAKKRYGGDVFCAAMARSGDSRTGVGMVEYGDGGQRRSKALTGYDRDGDVASSIVKYVLEMAMRFLV
jgi:hypothetical protein